jgi:hypothetical protein
MTIMSFRKSLDQTVNSLIQNLAPWGISASRASAFVVYRTDWAEFV